MSLGATKRALVIGIGAYPQNKDNYWNPIHGDHDVPLIKGVLLEHGFKERNIATLINEQATYHGMKFAFEKLISQVGLSDTIYIHFSGHGQLITDLDGDEPSGYDEAWIPYDALQIPCAGYKGQNHFVDDELNKYLHRIRTKVGSKGHIVVVADACHSAGGSRAQNDEVVRGTTAKFEITGHSRKKYIASNSEDWLFLSACTSEGFNRQCKVDGEWYGSLSYAIFCLSSQLSLISSAQLRAVLEETMYSLLHRSQTPVLDGPPNLTQQPLL